MNIIHFITALENGGAEKILFDTISNLNQQCNHQVIVLSKRGVYCHKLEKMGVSVRQLSLGLLWSLLFFNRKTYLIHSYLYHSHLGSLLFKIMGYRVIWSIHSSFSDSVSFKTKLVGLLSYFVPNKTIYVSRLASKQHISIGFNKKKTMVIYNGLDVDKFNVKNKCTLNVDKSKINIGMIARYHCVKNYPKFASIAAIALQLNLDCHFYLIGQGNNKHNHELMALLTKHNIDNDVTLVGEVSDISKILPCFNLIVSTSKSESFGLTILEAILSKISVSTIKLAVMDELLGVYTANEGDLTDAKIAQCWLDKANNKPSDEMIKYVYNHYSLDKMSATYLDLYEKILK